MSETDSSSSDEASGSEDEVAAWIGWFCSLREMSFSVRSMRSSSRTISTSVV